MYREAQSAGKVSKKLQVMYLESFAIELDVKGARLFLEELRNSGVEVDSDLYGAFREVCSAAGEFDGSCLMG